MARIDLGLEGESVKVISSKNETVRLFKSDFMEFFTRVHWSVPLILFVPLMAYCLYRGWTFPGMTPIVFFSSLVTGLVAWSLMEYLLHRFLFHYHPKSPRLKRIFYLIHEVHHEYPQDSLRLVMPPIESIPFAITLWFLFSWLLSPSVFFPFFAGFAIGYLSYDMIHYSVHHLPMKNRAAQYLKKHHLKHHFTEPDRGYGVSSPCWDWVFRTQFKEKVNIL